MDELQLCASCGKKLPCNDFAIHKGQRSLIVQICDKCCKDLHINKKAHGLPFSTGDLFTQVLDPLGASTRDQKTCPSCKTSFEDLRLHGRVGCSECFSYFHDEIEELLPRIASRPRHEGSVPQRLHTIRRVLVEKSNLKERLDMALAAEDYESAAQLRDAIHEIDGEGGAYDGA